jgi:peptidoglycan/xylan/chitin deacetylase (PgdA/CDA1 family)
MKRAAILLFSSLIFAAISNAVFASHDITRWKDNHTAAVSLAFDDDRPDQISIGVPLLSARNLKGTFFLVTSWIPGGGGTWEQWRQVAAQGHEIGSHSVTHPDLTELSEQEVREELEQSRDTIDSNIPSQRCVSFAYPYGRLNDEVEQIVSEYYVVGARGLSTPVGGYLNHYYTEEWWSAMDFYNIAAMEMKEDTPYEGIEDSQSIEYWFYYAEQLKAWFVPFFHSVDTINYFTLFRTDGAFRKRYRDQAQSNEFS